MFSRSAHQQLRIPDSGIYSSPRPNMNRQTDDTDSSYHRGINPPLSNPQFYEDDTLHLCHPARFPAYQSKQIRLQTFTSWLKHQQPAVMAEAGLYYTYHSDSVRCFQCGIGLSGWEPEDDPFVEHARWSPQCEYVIAKKGREFVQLVQEAVQSQSVPEEIIPQIPAHIHHDADLEVDHAPSVPGNITIDGVAPLTFNHSGSSSHMDQSQHAGVNPEQPAHSDLDQYPESTLRKNPLLTDAAQSVIEMGYLPRVVKRAVDNVLQYTDWRHLTGQLIMEEILSIEELGETTQACNRNRRRSIETDCPLPATSSTDLRSKLEEENQTYRDMTTCKICTVEPVGIVFLPCGHLVCCPQCAPALRKCPMCRKPVKGTVRVSFK